MERKGHAARPCSPKQSPEKTKHTTRGFLERFRGPTASSLRDLLRSVFSCSGAGAEGAADHQSVYNEKTIKRSIVSTPARPDEAGKHKQAKHAPSELHQEEQHGGVIQLSVGFKKGETDDNGEDWQSVTDNNLSHTEKQEIKKQEPPLPYIFEPSSIMSESLQSLLFLHLPTLVRGREWVLLYSTWKHGISLRTLYRQSSQLPGPSLLAVEDSKGAVFGGLLTSPLNPTTRSKFEGTHDSFVFTNAGSNFQVFHSTGLNRYYFICSHDMLAFGGGSAFALRLDEDLMHGSSGLSETFGNCCLSNSEEFNIRHVELWGFAHKSAHLSKKDLC